MDITAWISISNSIFSAMLKQNKNYENKIIFCEKTIKIMRKSLYNK